MKALPCWLLLAILTGCAPPVSQARYDWHGYDRRLVALMAHPEGLAAYETSLRQQLEAHPDGDRVPPGIHAEYGYVLLLTSRKADAARFFSLEKQYWPESATLMDRMLAACVEPAPAAAAPVPIPAATPAPPGVQP